MPRPFVRCTFAVSHETHENGPLRPRRLPVGSSPVSDGWRLCGALWRGWRIESPLGIRGGGGRASASPRVRPLPASGGSVRSRWCFFAVSPADGLPSLPRFRLCRVDLAVGGCGCSDGFGAGGVRSPLRWLPLACAVSACPRRLSPVRRSASAASRFGRAASGRPAEKRNGAPRQECAACRFRAVWSVVRQLPQGLRPRGLYAASRPRRRRPQSPCLWFPKLHGLPHLRR